MPLKCNASKYCLQLLAWIVVTGFWLTSGVFDAEAGNAIRRITPMREMANYQVDVRAHDYFDVVGRLNLIENDRMIIGDRELNIAPGVNTSRARQWNLVGAKLNKAGEVMAFETISDEPN